MIRRTTILLASMLAGTAAVAQDAPAPAGAAAAAPAAAPTITVGAAVSDASGAAVGTVSAVASGNVTVDTGTAKAAIPASSFAQGQSGLVIGMTKAELEAAVSQAKAPAITVGANVVGPKGMAVGKVAAMTDTLVTVQTSTSKVQLPKTAFVNAPSGGLMIGMTQAELDAAAKGAAGPAPK